MHSKRSVSVLSCIALLLGLVAFAVPAQAQQQVTVDQLENLMPNGAFNDKDQLSDAFDGVDQLAHLTATADPDADRVFWFVCTAGGAIGSQACTQIGSDATGVQRGDAEAYELLWNIPANLEGGDFDIVSRACAGEPSGGQTGTAPTNCRDDREASIHMDDGGTTRPGQLQPQDIGTGEITGVCPFVETGTQNCADGQFAADGHGGVVPNEGFTLRFRTSDDVSPASACIDTISNGTTGTAGPSGCDEYPTQVQLVTDAADHKVWDAAFGTVANNAELDIAIYGDGVDQANECPAVNAGQFTGNDPNLTTAPGRVGTATEVCVFDEHFKLSTAGGFVPPERDTTLTFVPGTPGTPAANCDRPDKEESNPVDGNDTLVGCLVAGTGQPAPAGTNVTFESTGPGNFTACGPGGPTAGTTGTGGPGTRHDHNNDGEFEHCHTTTDANGEAWATINNPEREAGDQNITFCGDPEAGTFQPEHGCADETAAQVDAAVKHWVAQAAQSVTLVFDDGDGDCQGPTSRNNQVGDQDLLIACPRDAQGNPVTTEQAGGGSLRWSIQQGADDETDTRFVDTPEQEADETGQAEATLEARDPGTDTILVELLNEQGQTTARATVQKNVQPREGPPPDGREIPCTVSGTDGPDTLTGTEGDDVICGFGGDDVLNGLGGDDILAGGFGSDTLNGDAGQDTLEGDEINSCLEGGEACGGPGSDTLNGGEGKDTARGDDGNDVFNGGNKNDLLIGGGGDDELNGENGWDTIRGNVGDDTLRGARGRDILQGGVGNDTARGGSNDDTIRGFTGSDRLIGHAGDDIIKGGTGNDTLRGGRGEDILNGGAGRDSCRGGPGSDVLRRCETR